MRQTNFLLPMSFNVCPTFDQPKLDKEILYGSLTSPLAYLSRPDFTGNSGGGGKKFRGGAAV